MMSTSDTHGPAERAERAARLLLEARRAHRPLERLPDDCQPRSVEEGYAVQDALARLDGRPVGGWKIGCTSSFAQRLMGIPQPFPGRVFAATIHASPAVIDPRDFIAIGLEPEFAFRLARDLPPRAEPYGRRDVEAAVGAFHPSCELVEMRFLHWRNVGGPSLIADNGCNGALVLGAATEAWRTVDLAAHELRLSINGKLAAEGKGAAALGHPLAALAWLANDRSRHGSGLKAGEVVTTGTCAGVHDLKRGDEAEADYGELGRVALSIKG